MIQKLFKGYIFCFLVHSDGRYIFELSARETNLMKKRSVNMSAMVCNSLSCVKIDLKKHFGLLSKKATKIKDFFYDMKKKRVWSSFFKLNLMVMT